MEKAADDHLLTRDMLARAVQNYLGASSALDPRASPQFADLSGLPPLLIQVGDDEVLLDDATRAAAKVEESGGDVHLSIWTNMIHVFPSLFDQFTTSKQALDDLARFLSTRLSPT